MNRGRDATEPTDLRPDTTPTEPGDSHARFASEHRTDPGLSSGDTPVASSVKQNASGTDPGLDPLLKAFNRPPRPPAPQPNLRASSDGDEFAAHYAAPREAPIAQGRQTAHDPAVLVELADLARRDASPPEATPRQRDIETAVVVRRAAKRTFAWPLAIALVSGATIAALFVIAFQGSQPGTATAIASESQSANPPQPLPNVASAALAVPSSAQTISAATVARSSPEVPSPVVVRSALPAAVMAPPSAATPSLPRPAAVEHPKAPASSARPPHENPDTVL